MNTKIEHLQKSSGSYKNQQFFHSNDNGIKLQMSLTLSSNQYSNKITNSSKQFNTFQYFIQTYKQVEQQVKAQHLDMDSILNQIDTKMRQNQKSQSKKTMKAQNLYKSTLNVNLIKSNNHIILISSDEQQNEISDLHSAQISYQQQDKYQQQKNNYLLSQKQLKNNQYIQKSDQLIQLQEFQQQIIYNNTYNIEIQSSISPQLVQNSSQLKLLPSDQFETRKSLRIKLLQSKKIQQLQKQKQVNNQDAQTVNKKNINYSSMIKKMQKRRFRQLQKYKNQQKNVKMLDKLSNPCNQTLRKAQIIYKDNKFHYGLDFKTQVKDQQYKIQKCSQHQNQTSINTQHKCLSCKQYGTYFFRKTQLLKLNQANYIKDYLQSFL